MLKRKTWNLYAVYTVMFCKIVLHLNSIDSRYIFGTCCAHLIISVALLCKDIVAIVAVPLFQWENPYTKITTPLHTLGHKTRMANDIAILFSDLAFLMIFKYLECKIFQECNY